MPGATANEHLPYPYIAETVTAASQQSLATAIEASLTSVDVLRLDALKPPTSMANRVSSSAITVNTDTVIQLSNQNIFNDPTSIHSISVNPDQFVMPTAGIYYVHGEANLAATTLTAVKVAITQNGTQVFAHQSSPKGSAAGWILETDGVVVAQAGDIIRLSCRWSGTGAGVSQECFLHVMRLCYLA